jgi:hypothetical protein
MMGTAKHIGRVGALAAALEVADVLRTATRMTVSTGVVAVVVMATAVPVPASTVSPAVWLSASSACTGTTEMRCALLMGGTSGPTLNDADVEGVMNQFIAPTHPDQTIKPIKVTTPEEFWPITGLLRLLGFAFGDSSIFGPGGAAWPDEPWWKLSGLFDLTFDQSTRAGVADLEAAMADSGNDHLVILGYSQSAAIANMEKQRLTEQYPDKTTAPDIDFVLGGDPNLPNGGLWARFPGLYIPILDLSLNGPEPTDTPFDTVVFTRQYDGIADFPLYPLNLVADLNAVLGFVYVHTHPFDVSLAPDPSASRPIKTQAGDTSYYFFPTADLPLFGPLRSVGVPESVIDVVEPVFKVLVELGYDRSIPPWEPTPARLIPPLHPATVAADLVNAIGQGINNAAALIGAPPPLSIPAAPAADQGAVVKPVLSAPGAGPKRVGRDVGDGVSRVLSAVESQLLRPSAVTRDNLEASQDTVGRERAARRDHITGTISAVKSVIGNGRTIARSAGSPNDRPIATPTRRTPLRDAAARTRADVEKVVTQVSDNVKKVLGGARDKADTRPKGGAGAAP